MGLIIYDLKIGRKDLLFIYYCKNNHLAEAKWMYEHFSDELIIDDICIEYISMHCNLEILKWITKIYDGDYMNNNLFIYKMLKTCNYHKLIFLFKTVHVETLIDDLHRNTNNLYNIIKWIIHVQPNIIIENELLYKKILWCIFDADELDTLICILPSNPLILESLTVPKWCPKIQFWIKNVVK